MKRIFLRFESHTGTLLTTAIIAIVMGLTAGIAFSNCEIAVGCLLTVFCAGSIAAFLYYILRKEVIIDFKHNFIKLKAGSKKKQCELDKVKNLEIVFHRVQKMNCYSAQIFAYLKDGETISIKIYPKSYRYRLAYYVTGKVTDRSKLRIERQVNGYDFITCRTKNES